MKLILKKRKSISLVVGGIALTWLLLIPAAAFANVYDNGQPVYDGGSQFDQYDPSRIMSTTEMPFSSLPTTGVIFWVIAVAGMSIIVAGSFALIGARRKSS